MQIITNILLFVNPNKYKGNNNYDKRYSNLYLYNGSGANVIFGLTITAKTGILPSTWYLRVGIP